ncbi:mechanosensitive ion channel family protein [Radiobacillus kanasensis]|uniref:mechanosensitive ion channel family protein n=1 Tax=Radiobacillus kanasensis TaxID=2844358 RepID=UPI001E350863|nr:mechanosensitive ion channel family protein [Radiobacillus kanasensis]UFT99413.1 mechanosensitive ion channel family protein [Radiobacillus kanasensis]
MIEYMYEVVAGPEGNFQKEWNGLVEKIIGPQLWLDIGQVLIRILIIFLMATVVIKIGKNIIDRLFRKRERGPFKISERRENTLKKLIHNSLNYVVYFTSFIMILEALSIPVGALLAGAGFAGLAIGFGTQNLVKDLVTGFFIIFEDQFSVGDYVQVSGIEGEVDEIGLRTTKIKSWTGELHILPNGNITQITNYSIHNSIAVVDVKVPYETDIERVDNLIQEVLRKLPARYPQIVSPPESLGVQLLDASHIVLRITVEVQPMTHWEMSRIIRKEIKQRFDEENIDIPYPRMVMYAREQEVKEGE